MDYFMFAFPILALLSCFIVVSTFIIGLTTKLEGKLFSSLRFVAIGLASLSLILGTPDFELYGFFTVIVSAIIIMLLQSNKRYALPIAWIGISVILIINTAIFIGSIVLYEMYLDAELAMESYLALFLTTVVGLGLTIAATIIRAKRNKTGVIAIAEDKQSAKKSKIHIAGNILAVISYVMFILAMRELLLYITKFGFRSNYNFDTDSDKFIEINEHIRHFAPDLTMFIVYLAIAMHAGVIAFFMIWINKKRVEYNLTAMDFALYIWSWIIIAVYVIVLIISVILLFATGYGNSSYQKSGARVVTDENGKKHKLDYKGGKDEEITDESGTVWVTNDGGMTFRKRDTYEYVDKDGKTQYLQDKYGTTGRRPFTLEDNKGTKYDVGLWGETEKREWGSDPEYVGTIKESAAVKAEQVDE